MPSQEDKRNGFTDQPVNGNEEREQAGGNQALDIDAVSEMSQEEIERLLSHGAAEARSRWQPEEEDTEEDVLDMLEDTKDDNLQNIQDLLQKSDRNETIDSSEEAEDPYGEGPADKLMAEIEEAAEEAPVDSKTRNAMEKERKAQERARQKEEKAARKKAAREAARAQRQAKKDSRKKSGADQAQDTAEAEDANEVKEYDLLLDKDLLDSIVHDAGNLGKEEKGQEPARESIDTMTESFGAAEEQSTDRTEEKSMMERTGASANGSENDIMELDMDEVDAFIPDVSESEQETEKGGKKKGLVSKIVTMLMEEEPENEDIPLSEENQEIIKDLDAEKSSGKKTKQKAKKPAKKKEKKKKAPKPPKPKKEKKPKEKEVYVGKKITFKKALPVLLLGATVGAVVFIFVYVASDYSVKQEAANAYAQGDYQTCYQNLYGKKLTEEEQQMYVQAESLLYIRQKYRMYEAFLREGSEAEALDSLIQTVNGYPSLVAYASQWEMLPEMGEIYASMLNILSDRYGLTEEQALAIAAIKSNIEYTRTVTAVAGGEAYGNGSMQDTGDADSQPDMGAEEEGGTEAQPEELPDELPEESELEGGSFVDNE